MKFKVDIRRVYDEAQANEGYRVLVDRLWPRGLSRREVQFDIWSKDLAPSTELRKWFAHKPEHWEQFGKDYQTQLRTEEQLQRIKELIRNAHAKHMTLLYSARDTTHNHAVILAKEIARVAGRMKAPNGNREPA